MYNYLYRSVFYCSLQSLKILESVEDWTTPDKLARSLENYSPSSIASSIRDLTEANALVVEDADCGHLDQEFEKTWLWGPSAGIYHFGTRDGEFLSEEEAEQILRERVKVCPSPPLFTTNQAYKPTFEMPLKSAYGEPFLSMAERRTNRRMVGEAIRLEALSDCLTFSMAITGILENPNVVDLPLKMTPSGGARNPYEAYVCVRNVQGLPPGVYHYSAIERTLGTVILGDPPPFPELFASQSWTHNAAAAVFLVANLDRPMWKYHDPGTYQVILIEAGHIGQNIMLAATKHGMVANPTCAISQVVVEKLIGLKRLTESVVYALVLGFAKSAHELENEC